VLDAARLPVPGVTLALYQKDTWVQALGYACTNDNGYFVLPVADATKADIGALSLRILRSGNIIFTDPRPVTVQPGHVEYREIVLCKTPDVCPPPAKPDTPTPTPPATTTATGSINAGGSPQK
jgi:hypothetical protein